MNTIEPHIFPARRAGNDLPVVALHCSASTGCQWQGLIARFAGQRQVVTPDLPGYGIAADDAGMQDPTSLAGEAEAVLRSVGDATSAFHLIGHSYGGAVALKLALRHPARVRSLTLIEPVVFHLLLHSGSGEDMRHYRDILGVRDRIRGAVAAGWPAFGMAAFVDFWSGEGAWDGARMEQRQHLAGQANAVLRDFAAVLGETWPAEDVARLSMPLLTIAGSESPAISQRLADRIVDTARDVTAARIFGAGHMAPITHTETVNDLIERHLRVAETAAGVSQPQVCLHRSPAAA
ncbi:MAG: alpha/beta fold hydrolase [Kiloniellaceae bacterium]